MKTWRIVRVDGFVEDHQGDDLIRDPETITIRHADGGGKTFVIANLVCWEPVTDHD